MPITENEKVQAHPRPSSDCFRAIPIKKRRIFYPSSPSPPPDEGMPESVVAGNDTIPVPRELTGPTFEVKPEPLKLVESTFPQNGEKSAQVNTLISEKKTESSNPDSSVDLGRTSNDREMDLNNNTHGTQQVTTFSGTKEIFAAAASTKCESVAAGEGIAVKQESLELQNPQNKSVVNSDSQHLFLNRSNWDLNTPMDTWEGSSIGVSVINRNGDAAAAGGDDLQNKQILHTGPSGTDCELHKNDHHLKSEACLDLQLKPSFLSMPGKPVAVKEMPFLSLATNPASSSLQLPAGKTVKSEPIECGQKETGKTQMGIVISPNLNHVKSEPCEGKEVSKTTVTTDDVNSAGTRAIKPEPLEDQALKVGRPFPLGLCSSSSSSSSLAPQTSLLQQNSDKDNSKAVNVASEPPGPDSSVVRSEPEKLDINVPNCSSDMVGKGQNLIPDTAVSTSTTVIEAATETASELSTVVPNPPVISDVKNTQETSSMTTLNSFPEPLISNGENYNPQEGNHSDGEVVDMDLSDDEVLRNLSRNSKVSEPGEVDGKVEGLGKAEGNVVSGVKSTTRKQCGGDEDYEDGEVRDRALKDAAISTSTVDVPVSKPLQELKGVDSLTELEAARSKGSDDAGLGDNRVEPSSSTASVPSAVSDKSRLSKTIRRIPKDFQKKNDKDMKSGHRNSKTVLPVQQQNASGSNLATDQVPSKIEPSGQVPSKIELSAKEDATKDGGKNTRIICLNPASNGLAPGKEKLMPSRVDRSHSRGSRDDSGNERPWKFGNERYYSRPVEKCEIQFRRADLISSLHGDRNATYDSLEQRNTSGGARYPRRRPTHSSSEVANGGSPDGSTTRFTSRFQYQRRSPGGRAQIPMGVRHPVRVNVPNFEILAAHEEEKMMRNLPEDMVEHSMLPPPHHHPRSQFERADDFLMHRERRSFSPPMRRGGGRPGQHRPSHQWSPPRRHDGYGGSQEFVRCRSPPPPVMRVNKMQPPQERPCFPEEIMVRRRGGGSPPYVNNRVANNMMEHDFPRQVRGPNRIPRRFNMMDPRDIAEEEEEEEYIGHIQEFAVEGEEEDGFVEDRRSAEERQGPIRPFRQQRFVGNDRDRDRDSEGGFRFHIEDGPPPRGALRGFRPNTNEEFDLRFRNRLGNSSGRMRGIDEEQEGSNYRHHEEQEWHGPPTFNDGRPKRRRY